MKKRTLEELHDKEIGHRKFAKVCDLLIEQGHKITEIKEYYEKFDFYVDDMRFEYSKNWKSTAKGFVAYILDMIQTNKEIEKRQKL